MSRWDALKTDSTSGRCSRNDYDNIRKTKSQSNRWYNNNNNKKQSSCTSNTSNNNVGKNDNNKDNILERYNELRRQYNYNDSCSSTNRSSMLVLTSLARLVKAHYNILSPEENSITVIQNIFLLNLDNKVDIPQHVIKCIIETIIVILKDKKHSSAILAPLTNNVSENDGKEQIIVNPVRTKLFHVLQNRLINEIALDEVIECFTLALQVSKCIDKSCNNNNNNNMKSQQLLVKTALYTSKIEQFLNNSFLNDEIKSLLPSLTLLLELLRSWPQSSKSLVKFLLFQDYCSVAHLKRVCCQHCSFIENTTNFLNIMHTCKDIKIVNKCMDCTSQLLQQLPLSLWLITCQQQSDTTTTVNTTSKTSIRSINFRDRVISALTDLIRICQCHLIKNSTNKMSLSYYALIKSIMIYIPYQYDLSLLNQACQLLDKLFSSYQLCLVDKNNQSSIILYETIIECCGGRITPQGELTTMSLPLSTWLIQNSGQIFIQKQCTDIVENNYNFIKLLSAMLRTYPDAILHDKETWNSFQFAVKEWNSQYSVELARVLEAFMQGRNDFGSISESEIHTNEVLDFVLPILLTYVSSSPLSGEIRSLAVSAIGSMKYNDWRSITKTRIESLLHNVLRLCGDPNSNDKLKAGCCKSVGNICSVLLGTDFYWNEVPSSTTICNDILSCLNDSMADCGVSVKCMALFAIGNLMQVLQMRSQDSYRLLDTNLLSNLKEQVIFTMEDKSDKVAVNAIRAAGYMSCLLMRNVEGDTQALDVSVFLVQVFKILNEKVRMCLELVQKASVITKGWNERNGIKKQCRSACNALSVIFKFITSDFVRNDDNDVNIEGNIICLLEAAENFQLFDEKVAITILSAIRSYDIHLFKEIALQREALVSNVLESFCHFRFIDSKNCNTSLRQEIDLILTYLLKSLGTGAVKVLVKSQDLGNSEVFIRIFDWMVSCGFEQDMYQHFVSVMRNNCEDSQLFDVQVEQKFVNMALQNNTDFTDEL